MKKTRWEGTSVQHLIRNATSGRFYGQWTVDGKQKWRALHTSVFTVARLRLNDEAAKIEKLRGSKAAVASGAGSVGDLMRIYEERVKANKDLKPKSLEARITGLRKLRKTWPELETLKPRSVTPAGIAEWATTFKNGLAGNSATSVNGAIDTLRRLMDIAVARGAIHANPVAVRPEDGEGRLKKKRTPKKLTLPSMANTHRLFVAIENSGNLGGWSIEIADFCRFLFFSGCRIGETPAVTWSCVDWSKKQLHVKGSKTATSDRIVPLFAETEALLKRVVERRKGMGVGVADRIFRVSECQKSIDRACKKIEIPRITHHDFRHLFATHCIESGVDIPTVSRWLGHNDGGVLAMRTYGHLRQEHSATMAAKVTF